MKYLGFCLLALPLLSSCVERDQYSERGYYNNQPSQVEVHRIPPTRHFHETNELRAAHQERVHANHAQPDMHQHPSNYQQENVHGHQVRPNSTESAQQHSHGNTNHVNQGRRPMDSSNETEENLHGHN